jgi:hypothetical protein
VTHVVAVAVWALGVLEHTGVEQFDEESPDVVTGADDDHVAAPGDPALDEIPQPREAHAVRNLDRLGCLTPHGRECTVNDHKSQA